MDSGPGLVQIVDAALAEAVRKAGPWLACKPGCTPCCHGPFAITPDDARRLQEGLAALDEVLASEIRGRARDSLARLERDLPGDTLARILGEDEPADGEPCPVLNPTTGLCDLYEARPITCRTFGPPVHFRGENIGICELCFDGALPAEIAACAVEIPGESPDMSGETIVAYALAAGE
jgi:Fe-S-cluster containining protein